MPSLFSGEQGLHKVQISSAAESPRGTAATVDTLMPTDSSAISTLDRAYISPNEDYGELAMNQPDRGIYGVRLATLPHKSVGLYEYMPFLLGSLIEGGVVATNPIEGVDQYVYTRDMTGDSIDTRTIEEGDNVAVFQLIYAFLTQLKLSFQSLGAPANVPLNLEGTWNAQDKILQGGGFSDADAIANPEAIVGQTARLYLDTPTTAYDSLGEAAGFLAYDSTIPSGNVPRKYGSADDKFTHLGKVKAAPTLACTVYETSALVSQLWTGLFNESDAVAHNLRSRVKFTGRDIVSGHPYLLQIDGMVQAKLMPVGNDGNGARVFNADLEYAKDATLGSDIQVTLDIPTPA